MHACIYTYIHPCVNPCIDMCVYICRYVCICLSNKEYINDHRYQGTNMAINNSICDCHLTLYKDQYYF